MQIEAKEVPSQFIAEEMRAASAGSFPLSPGTMTGHYTTARLYWHYRQDILLKHTVHDIFGVDEPNPPALRAPDGHRTVHVDGLNHQIWSHFLTGFGVKHDIDAQSEIRTLMQISAASDVANFQNRLEGKKSRLVVGSDGNPVPSLLRAFMYEDAFPHNFPFFQWMFGQMRAEADSIVASGFKGTCGESLRQLMVKWSAKYPDIPFEPIVE